MGEGLDVGRAEAARSAHPQVVRAFLDANPGLPQLLDHTFEVRRVALVDLDLAARDRAGHHVGPGLHAVRDDAVRSAVQGPDPEHADGRRARALDRRPHRDQQVGEVLHLGLAGRVAQDGLAVGQARGHHHVLGAGHGDGVEADLGALEALGVGLRQPCSTLIAAPIFEGQRCRLIGRRWRSRRGAIPGPDPSASNAETSTEARIV
jgi:hypothetical protein